MTHQIAAIESPQPMLEGMTLTYSLTWNGASALSSPSAIVYKDGAVYTSTAMPSGSHSVSGNVQVLKPIVATQGDGGKDMVVIILCTVDGNSEARKMIINVIKDETNA